MYIDTTININRKTLERINRAAALLGTSREGIIASLFHFAGKRGRWRKGEWMRIQYQARNAGKDWIKPHMRFSPGEYSYYNDLKDVLKMSISFIIAYAVEHYLDEIMTVMKDKPDNYRHRNYIVTGFQIADVLGLIIYWGCPPEIPEYGLF